jgi:hypothetical protein
MNSKYIFNLTLILCIIIVIIIFLSLVKLILYIKDKLFPNVGCLPLIIAGIVAFYILMFLLIFITSMLKG